MRRLRRAGCVTAAVLVLAGCSVSGASTPHSTTAPVSTTRVVVSASRLPWRLPAAVARLVALPDGAGALLAGGLTSSGASAIGVYHADLAAGRLRSLGTLAQPVHDAAGARIGRDTFVFGGGAQGSTAAVQRFTGSGRGRVVGRLPQPRSDLSAVQVGGRTYVLGGYTGSTAVADVIATTDGRSWHTVARLRITVRYAAVAATGTTIWVFGGQHDGAPVSAVQRIDTTTGRVSVVGHLPTPLSDAAAWNLGGHLIVAGGRTSPNAVTGAVREWNPATRTAKVVAQLPVRVADAGATVIDGAGYLFGGENATQVASVQRVTVRTVRASTAAARPSASASPAASAPLSDAHPFNGRLLIADRGNDRLVLVDVAKHVLWRFPSATAPAPPSGFYFPDDAFFIHHGTAIISNQEGNDTIVEVAFPSGRPLWSYGHPRVARPRPGYLHEPDDAYLLRDGNVAVADANNCRVVLVSPAARQVGQIGRPGNCTHNPPTTLGYPNGDTPLADGNLLISEVHGSWISEYTLSGRLVWTVRLPAVHYPSDPQQIGRDRYLVADYSRPGGLYEFDRAGHILWSYHPAHGSRMLDHPSLAEVLPGGFIATNDDYRDRVVIIDPHSRQIVWQYGHTDTAGRRAGYLKIPDGFDLLLPDNTTPTHRFTG